MSKTISFYALSVFVLLFSMGYMTPLYNWERLGDVIQSTVRLFKRDITPKYDVRKEPEIFVERIRVPSIADRKMKKHVAEDEQVQMLKQTIERATGQSADAQLLEKFWRYNRDLKSKGRPMIDVPVEVFDASRQPYHHDRPDFEYIATTLDHNLISQVREEIVKLRGKPLHNRSESHLTIINPPEFAFKDEFIGLKQKISLASLNAIATGGKTRTQTAMQIFNAQQFDMYPICIGKASRDFGKRDDPGYVSDAAVYYIIVESKQALAYRKEVEAEYLARGGNPSHFCYECYRSHITIGFEARDWFESDWVYKTEYTCEYGINLTGMKNSDKKVVKKTGL